MPSWFLLDREPKGSLLERFDMTAIRRYFSTFEGELPRRLVQPWSLQRDEART